MDQFKIAQATETIATAITDHNPIRVYALVSGGHDSTVASHLAVKLGKDVDALVHINTGIGIRETGEYVRDFAKWLGKPLIEKHPPRDYEDLVMQYGFPGPAAHRYMYSWLKERPLREVRREAQNGQNRRVLYITGVRTTESRRRMGRVQSVKREGNTVWVAPIKDFDHSDVWDYREAFDLPRNEVVDFLHMSGECLCGAFSKPNELEWISLWYPDIADRIRLLEQRAVKAGLKSCRWGPQSSKLLRQSPGPLCSSCVTDETVPVKVATT